jgi:hypothetical protein
MYSSILITLGWSVKFVLSVTHDDRHRHLIKFCFLYTESIIMWAGNILKWKIISMDYIIRMLQKTVIRILMKKILKNYY